MPFRSNTVDMIAFSVFCAGLVYSIGEATTEAAAHSALREDRRHLRAEIVELEEDLARLRRQVDALVGPEIDPEMLDESLRRALGVGRADEVILIGPRPG